MSFHTRQFDTSQALDDAFMQALDCAVRPGEPRGEISLTTNLGRRGAHGEDLCVRWAFIGNPDAKTVFVVTTGYHGAEREPGTLFLISLLQHSSELRAFLGNNIALLVIDNLNPWGSSYMTRYDHKGRDTNRNNLTKFRKDTDLHPFYMEVDPYLNLPKLDLWSGLRSFTKLYRYSKRDGGFERLAHIIANGQSLDPKRMMYTGIDQCWSNLVLKHIVKKCLRACRHVVHDDKHTALGRSVVDADLLRVTIEEPGTQRYRRSERLWGKGLTSTKAPNPYTRSDKGTVEQLFFRNLAPWQTYTGICAEGGTFQIDFVITAMWLRHNVLIHQDTDPEFYAENDAWTRWVVRQAFAPNGRAWRSAFLDKSHKLFQNTICGIHDGALECA